MNRKRRTGNVRINIDYIEFVCDWYLHVLTHAGANTEITSLITYETTERTVMNSNDTNDSPNPSKQHKSQANMYILKQAKTTAYRTLTPTNKFASQDIDADMKIHIQTQSQLQVHLHIGRPTTAGRAIAVAAAESQPQSP